MKRDEVICDWKVAWQEDDSMGRREAEEMKERKGRKETAEGNKWYEKRL